VQNDAIAMREGHITTSSRRRLPAEWRLIALGVDEKVKHSLVKLCEREAGLQFAGVTHSITTLLFALEESHPEVVVLDEYSLGDDPVSALSSIHQACRRTRMLIIGDTLDAATKWEVLQLGVAGSLRRSETETQLMRAINAVRRGEYWLSRSQSSQLLTRLSADELREHGTVEPLSALTPQENRVMQQCMSGHSNKEIARALGISEQTVKIHLQHVFQKLGIRRRAELLLRRWAIPVPRPAARRSS
jgi:DNA-binding NarL/FixJ family response regulator